MWKYEPLKEYLQNSNKMMVELTYSKINEILGFDLPKAAFKFQAWWANPKKTPLVQQRAWLEAGYKAVDLCLGKKVIFERDIRRIFTYFGPPDQMMRDENKLKIAYKKKLAEYDPEKVEEEDLGEELIELAKKKTKEINGMYKMALSLLPRYSNHGGMIKS